MSEYEDIMRILRDAWSNRVAMLQREIRMTENNLISLKLQLGKLQKEKP